MIFQILAECTVFCERRNALTEFPMMDRCRRSRSALERIYAKVLENLGGLDRGITPFMRTRDAFFSQEGGKLRKSAFILFTVCSKVITLPLLR